MVETAVPNFFRNALTFSFCDTSSTITDITRSTTLFLALHNFLVSLANHPTTSEKQRQFIYSAFIPRKPFNVTIPHYRTVHPFTRNLVLFIAFAHFYLEWVLLDKGFALVIAVI